MRGLVAEQFSAGGLTVRIGPIGDAEWPRGAVAPGCGKLLTHFCGGAKVANL